MSKQYTQAFIFISLIFISATVFAHDEGDIFLRLGYTNVDPDVSSDALALNGTELSQLPLGLPVTRVDVDDNSQLGINIVKMLTDNWAVELLAATPFQHDIVATGLGVKAGKTKHLPPTLTALYYPMNGSFQPYFGLGVNYTTFFSEDVDTELDTALGTLGATGGADLSLDDSWGLSWQIGFDYLINNNWHINASYRYIDIETTADIDVPGLGTISADVELDPAVTSVTLGYTF